MQLKTADVMKGGKAVQRIIGLIEATLDADIFPQDLAEKSGYSLWHFLHLFRNFAGMPMARWQMRRRLAHAIWHVSTGMCVTDAALRWGFSRCQTARCPCRYAASI